MGKRHMIFFEIEGKSFAVDAAELAGVASGCPFVTYPGLPDGVRGIVQWSGRIFPVISPFDNDVPASECTFLFSQEGINGPFSEVAVAIPAKVRAWFPEEIGEETTKLSISELAEQECGKEGRHAA